MDITKWLADTAVAADTAGIVTDQPGYPAETSGPQRKPVADLLFNKRRNRKHEDLSTDSSILAPEDIPAEKPARRVVRHAPYDSDLNPVSGASSRSSRPQDEGKDCANPYQRRKRRKTKADRYDPKPQKQSKAAQDSGRQKRKPTAKDTGAKRAKDKSASLVVRNFHAANVPGERLTLQPRPSFGIFKKGKASSPFRGRGLPDLAFSEMKFLQKRKFSLDDLGVADGTVKRRKKDQVRVTEEEISSYFTPKRPPLAEKHDNVGKLQKAPQKDRGRQVDNQQRRSSTVPSIRTTIERLQQPDIAVESGGRRSNSNSYFTWSESIRHSSWPVIVRQASTTDLQAHRIRPGSNPLIGPKARASSLNIRYPDSIDKRERTKRTNEGDGVRIADISDPGLEHSEAASNHIRRPTQGQNELELDATKSISMRPQPVTDNREQLMISQSPRVSASVPPKNGAQPQAHVTMKRTENQKARRPATATELENPISTSSPLAKLLEDCDTAYLTSARICTPQFQPASIEHGTRSRSTNDPSTTRYHHQQRYRDDFGLEEVEGASDYGYDGSYFPGCIQDPRLLVQRFDMYEVGETDKPFRYEQPERMEYQVGIEPRVAAVACQRPEPEAEFEDVGECGPMNGHPYSDMGDEVLERPGIEKEDEDEDEDEYGLAGFWRPNMLY